jgi:hypothetical protein
MKEEILNISSDLREGFITSNEAKEKLLILFSTCNHKNTYIVSGVFGGKWCEDCKEMVNEE